METTRYIIKYIISWFLVFLLTPFLLFGAEYIGKVVSVIDGDTIRVLFDTSVPSAKLHKDGTVSLTSPHVLKTGDS